MVDDMSRRWDHLRDGFDKTNKYINDTINIEVGDLAARVKGTRPCLLSLKAQADSQFQISVAHLYLLRPSKQNSNPLLTNCRISKRTWMLR